jgi:hypothetical protein
VKPVGRRTKQKATAGNTSAPDPPRFTSGPVVMEPDDGTKVEDTTTLRIIPSLRLGTGPLSLAKRGCHSADITDALDATETDWRPLHDAQVLRRRSGGAGESSA